MQRQAGSADWELTSERNYDGGDVDVFWFAAERVDSPSEVLTVSPHYTVVEGVLHLLALHIWREGTEPVELTAEDLRSIPLSRLHTFARHLLAAEKPSPLLTWPPETPSMPPRDWLPDLTRRRRPGRGGRDNYDYAVVAARYVDLQKMTSAPVKELARELNLNTSQVRTMLDQARHRQLLTKSEAGRRTGRAYGELTDRAKELLLDTH